MRLLNATVLLLLLGGVQTLSAQEDSKDRKSVV